MTTTFTSQATSSNNKAAFDLIGLTQLRQDPRFSGIDGSGMSVAVIDTGLDSTHPLLQSAYRTGLNIATGSANPIDRFDHGTHVAGTIGARDQSIGVATDVDLIGIGVFEGTHASNSTIEAALEWVLKNHKQHNIVAVNLSLGGGFFGSKDSAKNSILYDDVQRLEAAGITVVSAAGNLYKSHEYPNLSEPAIFSTLAVGAVWKDGIHQNAVFNAGATDFTTGADRVASFSQRLKADNVVFAPGAYITSTVPGGGVSEMAGTSMAAPIVSGAVALMQEAAMQFGGRLLSPDEVRSIMQSTADTIFDGDDENDNVRNSNTSYQRLNVYKAIAEIERRFESLSDDANGTLPGAVQVPDIFGLTPTFITGQIGQDGGNRNIGNDVDLYQFEMTSAGTVTIQVNPDYSDRADFDSLLRIFDANGTEVAFDDNANTGNFSRISTFLAKGTYYAGVSGQGNRNYNPSRANSGTNGATGNYAIQFNTNTADPDGVISGATAVNLGTDHKPLAIAGYIGQDTVQDQTQLIAQADVDFYSLQATDSGTLLIDIDTPLSSGFVNSHLRVFDGNGNPIASNSHALATNARGQATEFLPAPSDRVYANPQHTQFTGHRTDSFIALSVTAGQEYYIGVSGASNADYGATSLANRATGGDRGSYTLDITFESNDQNGSIVQAQSLPMLDLSGMVQLETIGRDRSPFTSTSIVVGDRDVDIFRVNSPNTGILDVTVDSFGTSLSDTVDTSAFVFDADGHLLGSSDDVNGRDPTLKLLLTANTDYYVAIAGYGNSSFDPFQAGSGSAGDTGDYHLTSRLLNAATLEQYTDNRISSGGVQTVQTGTMVEGDIGSDRGFILDGTDVDLYRFVPQTSSLIHFRTLATEAFSADTYLRVFDSNGNELGANDDANSVTRSSGLTLSVTAGHTYFVGISGAGVNTYDAVTGTGLGSTSTVGQYTLAVTAASNSTVPGITQVGTAQADRFTGTDGDDVLVGKGGNDHLTGFGGNDTLVGNGRKDVLLGQNGDDWLNGGGGKDELFGDNGDDTLRGGGGKDILNGGAGDDWIEANKGRDLMTGESGNDVFVIDTKKGRDRITDFDLNDDRIGLMGFKHRDLSFTQMGNNTFIYTNGQAIARLDHIDMNDLTASHFKSL